MHVATLGVFFFCDLPNKLPGFVTQFGRLAHAMSLLGRVCAFWLGLCFSSASLCHCLAGDRKIVARNSEGASLTSCDYTQSI